MLAIQHWLRMWVQAFLCSSGTVGGFMTIFGLGVLPFQVDEVWLDPHASVAECLLDDNGKIAVSLIHAQSSRGYSGRRNFLAMHDLKSGRRAVRLPWPELQPSSIAASPTSKLIAVACRDKSIVVVDLDNPSHPPRPIGRHKAAPACRLALSGDGRWLASLDSRCLYVWDMHSGKLHWRCECGATSLAMPSDLGRLWCGCIDGSLLEFDLDSGHVVRTLASHDGAVTEIAVCRAGLRLASLGSDQRLVVTDLMIGAELWECRQLVAMPMLAFSPDGETIVSAQTSGSGWILTLRDARLGRPHARLDAVDGFCRGAGFTADGRLFTWGSDGTIRDWGQQPASDVQSTHTWLAAQPRIPRTIVPVVAERDRW
jgi:WD40 repeat protein